MMVKIFLERFHVFAAAFLIADRGSLPKEWSGGAQAGDIPNFGEVALPPSLALAPTSIQR